MKITSITGILVVAFGLHGQDKNPLKVEAPKKPDIKEVSPGIFQVGTVRLNKEKREISLPVIVNMNEGPMEYLVVTGK